MNASESEIRGINESSNLRFFSHPHCMLTLGIVETAFHIVFSLALTSESVKLSNLILLAVNAFMSNHCRNS